MIILDETGMRAKDCIAENCVYLAFRDYRPYCEYIDRPLKGLQVCPKKETALEAESTVNKKS